MTPTPEGKQLAADLANAEEPSRSNPYPIWEAKDFDGQVDLNLALARLATEHLALKAKHEEALADLREIDRIAAGHGYNRAASDDAYQIYTIAAKWRVETDPLVEAIKASNQLLPDDDVFLAAKELRAELSKRGYEIGRKS